VRNPELGLLLSDSPWKYKLAQSRERNVGNAAFRSCYAFHPKSVLYACLTLQPDCTNTAAGGTMHFDAAS
jgi:hypothetical protein